MALTTDDIIEEVLDTANDCLDLNQTAYRMRKIFKSSEAQFDPITLDVMIVNILCNMDVRVIKYDKTSSTFKVADLSKIDEQWMEKFGSSYILRTSQWGEFMVTQDGHLAKDSFLGPLTSIEPRNRRFAIIRKYPENVANLITSHGDIVCETWFDSIRDFCGATAKIMLDGQVNFITRSGDLISDEWFDSARYVFDGSFIIATIGSASALINPTDGEPVDGRWHDDVQMTAGNIFSRDGDEDWVKIEL